MQAAVVTEQRGQEGKGEGMAVTPRNGFLQLRVRRLPKAYPLFAEQFDPLSILQPGNGVLVDLRRRCAEP